jgi:DNA-binding transcriptional LysR family regulator
MNLDQLEAVDAIIKRGSFRAAAEYLRRSQPALSSSIKNLEEEFKIRIFDRQSYRPKLTEEGSIFFEASCKALEAAQFTARVARELGEKKRETRLRVAVEAYVSLRAQSL